jgi:hypothetical protein
MPVDDGKVKGGDSAAAYHRQRQAEGAACLAAALEGLARGWRPLPLCDPDHVGVGREHGQECKTPGKAPLVRWTDLHDPAKPAPTADQVRRWWRQNPTANNGLVLGPASGVVRVDVDGPAGEERLQEISGGDLPATLEFTSGRPNGGRGLLYKIPDGVHLKTTVNSHRKKEELRFQARGAQTVLPPSRHPSGALYQWVPGHGPGEIEPALAPGWLVELLRADDEPSPAGGAEAADGEFVLDPEAEPPAAKFNDLMKRKKFARSWERQRDDLKDQSSSGYDQSLTNLAARAGWEDREIVNLLVASRRKHGDALKLRPDYFRRTIARARKSIAEDRPLDVKVKLSSNGDGHNSEPDSQPEPEAAVGPGEEDDLQRLQNFEVITVQDEEDGKEKQVQISLTATSIRLKLQAITGGWPRRVGKLLFAPLPGYQVLWMESTDQVFGWVAGWTKRTTKWARRIDTVSKTEFFAHLTQACQAYDAVEGYPHHPLLPTHYYLHPGLAGGDGQALRQLLDRFRPASVIDRDLMLSAFLTPFWGGPPGQRPAFLVESEDNEVLGGRGVGKTKLAQAVAYLAGGHIDARPQEDFDKLMKRLLSPAALDRRVVLLDNVKTLRFSWADLEALITSDVISGYQLYVGEGRRPNTLVWMITLNNASLSKDMAQRCVIIKVKRPPHNPRWEEETWSFIDHNRWRLVGDIIAELKREAPLLKRHSRWAAWESAVLSKVGEPSDCQRVIVERQGAVDGDQEDADLVRDAFAAELIRRRHDPEREAVFIPSATAADIVNQATREKRPVNKATAYLGTLAIKELRRSKWTADSSRGYCWRGLQADAGQAMVFIHNGFGE